MPMQPQIPKAPTVTLPASMLQGEAGIKFEQALFCACVDPDLPLGPTTGPLAGAGMFGANKGAGPGNKRGRGGAVAPQPNQVYMNQLMALIQKRPDMKTQIMNILSRQDLDDSQRIELIGEILKAANIVTAANWGQPTLPPGGGAGGPPGPGGGGAGGPGPPGAGGGGGLPPPPAPGAPGTVAAV
jgi:hypothetical protein